LVVKELIPTNLTGFKASYFNIGRNLKGKRVDNFWAKMREESELGLRYTQN
jgi:hypothetical protein